MSPADLQAIAMNAGAAAAAGAVSSSGASTQARDKAVSLAQSAAPNPYAGVEGALLDAGEQALVDAMIPSKGGSEAADQRDAAHADAAFAGVLGAAVTVIGGFTGGIGGVVAGGAAALVRAAWSQMSYHEKARIWRGEVTR